MSRAISALKGAGAAVKNCASAAKRVAGAVGRIVPRKSVASAVQRYEKFTGVNELRELHKSVVAAQEKFINAQEKRREAGERLLAYQQKLRDIRDEMKSVSKGDPNYLTLITEEHKNIVEEDALRLEFVEFEKREREFFTEMTGAVKMSHETERFYAEKNKYLYIAFSIIGTTIGILGSNINNRIKMAEFKEMILEEKSGSKIWNLNFTDGPIQTKMKDLESRIIAVSTNQRTILDYIVKMEKNMESEFANISTLVSKRESLLSKALFDARSIVPEDSVDRQKIVSYTYYSALGIIACIFIAKFFS